MDVLSRFLVTLDFPGRKLLLDPLPPRPGESAAAPGLNTSDVDPDDSEAVTEPDKPVAQTDADLKLSASPPAPDPAKKAAAHGPYNRYIAPEMKDYTQVFRVGHMLILPAALNDDKIRLFIMDTGAWTTTISPQAAREVTKIHSDDRLQVKGINGEVKNVYSADKITFRFAHLAQEARDVVSFDNSKISKNAGLEISGFVGATTLDQLTIHIDYRDGLVKFDYDPKRVRHF
jgi:predicted aspartyl protease